MVSMLATLATLPFGAAEAALHAPDHDLSEDRMAASDVQFDTTAPLRGHGVLPRFAKTAALLQTLFHGRLPALEREFGLNSNALQGEAANGSPCQLSQDPFLKGLSSLLASATAISLLERATTTVDYARFLEFTIWSGFPMMHQSTQEPASGRGTGPAKGGRLPPPALPAVALGCLALLAGAGVFAQRRRAAAGRRQ